MSGSFESVRWNACAHRLDLGLYFHLKSFGGMESEPTIKPFVWCSDSRVALSGVPGLRLLHVPLLHYCVHGTTFSWYPLFSQSFAMGATAYLVV